eukprot:scaffold23018_cov55-Attheya_sp.AAC.1
MTDLPDIQSSPPMTPETMSQPTTQMLQPPTIYFEAAVPTLMHTEQISALVTQMAAITTMLEIMQTNNEDLEKYKRDLSNQVKADVILSTADLETRIETIDAKVAEVESDMQRHDLDINDLEAFQNEVTPKTDQEVLTCPASPNTSPDAWNDFSRFSGGYMGICTTLQKPVPPDEYYYKFVLPGAGASSTSSYVDPTTPRPAGTHATDPNGNPNDQGLFALANNLTVDIGKFHKIMHYLQLGGDDILSICNFYHGIRMDLRNTCGKHHIDLLPMFEDLQLDIRFSKKLLPHDSNGVINNTDYRYAGCLRMYHSMGQVILTSLTHPTKKVINTALPPKAYLILLSNKNLHNGWDLLWTILRKIWPHLGGTNLDVHDMITSLKIEPDSSYHIIYSQTQIPVTRLFFKFMTTLMTCGTIHMYIATNLDKTALYPDSTTASGNKAYNPSPSPQPHTARMWTLSRHMFCSSPTQGIQYPPPVKYPPRSPHQLTVPKPNIKALIGDLTDNDQLITDADPEIFDFIDQEDEFIDAMIDTPAAPPPSATLKQMSVKNYNIMPILPDYVGMFDPAEL